MGDVGCYSWRGGGASGSRLDGGWVGGCGLDGWCACARGLDACACVRWMGRFGLEGRVEMWFPQVERRMCPMLDALVCLPAVPFLLDACPPSHPISSHPVLSQSHIILSHLISSYPISSYSISSHPVPRFALTFLAPSLAFCISSNRSDSGAAPGVRFLPRARGVRRLLLCTTLLFFLCRWLHFFFVPCIFIFWLPFIPSRFCFLNLFSSRCFVSFLLFLSYLLPVLCPPLPPSSASRPFLCITSTQC